MTTGRAEPVEVVGLVASAGGLEALTAVLRTLPRDFPAAVLVAQHLGGQGSRLVDILARRTALEVRWAQDGGLAAPGTVTVCPARTSVEVLPDRTCAFSPYGDSYRERPLDRLLTSLADSLGAAGAGVVLTGLGRDAAEGARALRRAGGCVLVQDPASAEHAAMPRSVIEADAADLVLDLHDIGPALVQLAHGRALPRPRSEAAAIRTVFGDRGGIAAAAQELDWSRTPVGRVTDWPPLMRTVVRLAMDAPDPAVVLWGDEHLSFPNEATLPLVGERPGRVLARPYREGFPEAWALVRARLENLYRRGSALKLERQPFTYRREGSLVRGWFDLSYTSVRDAEGGVVAVQVTSSDRTREVLAARRLAVLNRLARPTGAGTRSEAAAQAMTVLGTSPDVPFAAVYLRQSPQPRASLVTAVGVEPGGAAAPVTVAADGAWPWAEVREHGRAVEVGGLAQRFPQAGVPAGRAVALPLRDEVAGEVIGMLVLGVDDLLPYDEPYEEFLSLVGETVAARVSDAHARARERERNERLLDLDQAKTSFFSNVSDEFRTPLTLLLAPLEEMLDAPEATVRREQLELVLRNARRLERLVGSLLDLSRLDTGRLRPDLVPTDLARLTTEVVAPFASVAEKAGIELRLTTEADAEPVWAEPEMWEKVVSHLLSNALKFTFQGRIEVTLRALDRHAELVVRDTGTGIPEEELPYVFTRFHRVQRTRARSHEGAGIGLALVDELVRRRHGRVRVTSTPGQGSTFTVWIPLTRPSVEDGGAEPGAPGEPAVPGRTGTPLAETMAEEASRWDTVAGPWQSAAIDPEPQTADLRPFAPEARVLVADGNRDVREYLARVLTANWTVDAARDGAEALALARRRRPDLVLTDVLMPAGDGLTLLQQLRRDEQLATTPVVLLTARTGEEAAIAGLLAGADDYLVKPFGARELLARVGAQLELDRVRRRVGERDRFLLTLGDALRPLADPREIMGTAARVLAGHLGVDRVAYGEVTRDGPADFPLPVADLAAGTTFVSGDVAHDERFSAEGKAVLAAMSGAATCSVPLVKHGRLVATLDLLHSRPRTWTEEGVSLAEEVAERTWAAVERARAQAQLHRFAALADADPRLVAVAGPELALLHLNAAGRDLAGADDLHGLSLLDLVVPEDHAALTGGRPGTTVRLRRPGSGAPAGEATAIPLTDGRGTGIGYALVSR